jgi:hypothetical protein
MSVVQTVTEVQPFRRVYATNVTATGYTAKADLTALPTVGDVDTATGYLDLAIGRNPGTIPNAVKLKFYAVGSNNNTGNCRVYGLAPVWSATGTSYTHVLLADYALTFSGALGVAGGVVLNTERYADTIARTIGIENVGDSFLSPEGDVAGHAVVDVKGFRWILVEPVTASSATSVNVLYAGL